MSIRDDYAEHDALGLAERVRRGEVRPSELLGAALARAEACADLGAIAIPMFDEGRRTAAGPLPDGPFRGVPFLLKDLYAHYAGVPTTNACRLFADFVPEHDSEITARFRRAGLVIFGKSASSEFGLSTSTESVLYGVTRNPWSRTHSAGGSSGGSAAAVAAGIVPAAHASDGGGSIRIPAACCGLFGLKPTRARVPAGPDVGEGWSGMSTAHAVTRSVRDSAALLDVVAGPAQGDPYWAPPPERPFLEEVGRDPGRLRIALVTRAFNGVETHPDCLAAALDAAKLCAGLGHDVEPARLEVDVAAFGRASQIIIASNLRASALDRAAALGRELTQDDLEPISHAMASLVRDVEAADYARAVRTIHGIGRQVAAFLASYDVLLTPTMATPPLPLGRLALTNPDLGSYLSAVLQTVGYTQLFNASGHPAASLPLCWNAEGLPIGVQLAARFGDEATIFRLSAQLEQARPWFDRRPADPAA